MEKEKVISSCNTVVARYESSPCGWQRHNASCPKKTLAKHECHPKQSGSCGDKTVRQNFQSTAPYRHKARESQRNVMKGKGIVGNVVKKMFFFIFS